AEDWHGGAGDQRGQMRAKTADVHEGGEEEEGCQDEAENWNEHRIKCHQHDTAYDQASIDGLCLLRLWLSVECFHETGRLLAADDQAPRRLEPSGPSARENDHARPR